MLIYSSYKLPLGFLKVLKMKENKITNYIKSSLQELTKVTWPTKNQAVKLTVIVLAFCLVFALFIAGIDFLANLGYTELLKLAF